MSAADSLLTDLEAKPDDVSLRERAARALDQAGRPAEAVKLLQQGLVHLNAHEPGALPCLCRRCIAPDTTTTTAGGMTFHRDFVVAPGRQKSRVLFFWMPDDLTADARRVRRSVATGLRSRIR